MQANEAGRKLIEEFEGCKLEAYQDMIGRWTIGYGHTGPEVHKGQTITKEEADALLKTDLIIFAGGVTHYVKVPLNENQFSALVSFCYNLGIGTLQKSTLLEKLNEGLYHDAADEFLKWSHAGGKLSVGLMRRRKAEQELFLKEVV